MTVHIKLYGDKGALFEAIKEDLTDEFGYVPSNPEVVGVLMAQYNGNRVAGGDGGMVADLST